MSCNKISMIISACIDNEITVEEKEMLENHIIKCADCRLKYERFKRTDNIFAVNKSIETAPFFETRFLQRLNNKQSTGTSILDMVILEKKLLLSFSAFLLIISAITLKSYLSDTTHGYTYLQRYVVENNSNNTSILNKQDIEADDIIECMIEGRF